MLQQTSLKAFSAIAVLIVLFFAGCATQPLEPKGQFSSSLNVQQTTELLYQQAVRCWQREQVPTADGIVARLEPLQDGTEQLLTMHRAAAGSVHAQPFFVARVYPDQPTSVKVAERAYGYGLLGVEQLNLTTQLQQWLKGHTECTPLAH